MRSKKELIYSDIHYAERDVGFQGLLIANCPATSKEEPLGHGWFDVLSVGC
jgi:hypothetical protein